MSLRTSKRKSTSKNSSSHPSKKPLTSPPDNLPSESFLDNYLDTFAKLPITLKDNFKAMRNLDERVDNKLKEIDEITADFLIASEGKENEIEPEKQVEFRNRTTTLFEQARIASDDKINFANKSYEEVDKYIHMLDRDLPIFEEALKARARACNLDFDQLINDDINLPQTKGGGYQSLMKIFPFMQTDEFRSAMGLSIENSGDGTDKPSSSKLGNTYADYIDPNEPTYCYCRQVSYGEMIACDSNECDIEWFHLACVNLVEIPKGKWYCPSCKPNFERPKKMAVNKFLQKSSGSRRCKNQSNSMSYQRKRTLNKPTQTPCLRCSINFQSSYLKINFNQNICDNCQNKTIDTLITKGEITKKYKLTAKSLDFLQVKFLAVEQKRSKMSNNKKFVSHLYYEPEIRKLAEKHHGSEKLDKILEKYQDDNKKLNEKNGNDNSNKKSGESFVMNNDEKNRHLKGLLAIIDEED